MLSRIKRKITGREKIVDQACHDQEIEIPLPVVDTGIISDGVHVPPWGKKETYNIFVIGDNSAGKEQFTLDLVSHYFSPDEFGDTRFNNEFLSRPITLTTAPLLQDGFSGSSSRFESSTPPVPFWYAHYASLTPQRVRLQITHDPFTYPGCIDQTRREEYERSADGFIAVYAVNDRGTFNHVQKYVNMTLSKRRRQEVRDIPMVVVGNRCERVAEREVGGEEAEDVFGQDGWGKKWREVSFVTKEGVEGLLEEVVGGIWRAN